MVKITELYRDCPECGADRLFEQPHPAGCPDTPDGECPEWACIVCGTALITAIVPAPAASRQPVRAA